MWKYFTSQMQPKQKMWDILFLVQQFYIPWTSWNLVKFKGHFHCLFKVLIILFWKSIFFIWAWTPGNLPFGIEGLLRQRFDVKIIWRNVSCIFILVFKWYVLFMLDFKSVPVTLHANQYWEVYFIRYVLAKCFCIA